MTKPAPTPEGGSKRPPPPSRPAMSTGEYLAMRVSEKESDSSKERPRPSALLEVIAEDVVRQGKEIAELRAQQAERTKLARRSFDWMRVIALVVAAVGTGAPFAAIFWGEWIRLHPEVGATIGGSLITAVLGTLTAAKLHRRAERRKAEEGEGESGGVALINERDEGG